MAFHPGAKCSLCQDGFTQNEKMVNSSGELWHERCFVCVQCFKPFPDGLFFEHENHKYCEHDYQTLYAPCCAGCGEFAIGRVIRALAQSWHPDCFKCTVCKKPLADIGFVKHQGRPLCKPCNAEMKGAGMKFCMKCNLPIHGENITYRNQVVHPHHFNCRKCGKQLTHKCRERDGDLYCLRCFDNLESAICAACRRPIEGRIIHALAKMWHPEHFVCAQCEKVFDGRRHFERKGLAYCETDYSELFGDICFSCNKPCKGDVVNILNNTWCIHHFRCVACDVVLSHKSGAHFIDMDLRPYCRKCFDKVPTELRRRLKKRGDL